MAISDEERKRRDAARQREYRRTHPNYDRTHIERQQRYMARLRAGLVNGLKPVSAIKAKKIIIQTPKTPKVKKVKVIKKQNTKLAISNNIVKRLTLTHYGGGQCACVQCGYSDIDSLTIDHINNDAHHRQNKDRVGGQALYRKLIKSNYPEGYQTLCFNCNNKKAIELVRKNGGHKKGTPRLDPLPLLDLIKDDIEECHLDVIPA